MNKNVGKRIREARKKAKLSIRELAEMADISQSFLGDIENSRSNPSLERLSDIAAALDEDVSYFIDEKFSKTDSYLTNSLDEDIKNILLKVIDEKHFKEILKAFDGFEMWTEREKIELLAYLNTKKKYKDTCEEAGNRNRTES